MASPNTMKALSPLVRSALIPTILFAATVGFAADDDAPLFPFVLPWDDASPGITDMSGLLHKPAGKLGHITASPDGHFMAGGQRVRFMGVNMCFAATVPQKEHAEVAAKRLAKFGINVVRFHHMDTGAWPRGIRAAQQPGTVEIQPEALDRLDYFISQLKQNGVYANINLLVGRPFKAADGQPPEIEKLDWKDRHIVGFFDARQVESQKEYARRLLGHVNPYTKLTLAEDPAVAFVEINNENGLVHAWLGGEVDRLPEVFQRDLQRQWNGWLKTRYGTSARLQSAWNEGAESLGAELLANGDFSRQLAQWVQEKHAPAQMQATLLEELPPGLTAPAKAVRLTVAQVGRESWHLQFNQAGLKLQAGKSYTLSFWARTDAARNLSVVVSQAHEPWNNLGLSANAAAGPQWKQFQFVFKAAASDDNARVSFSSLGPVKATADFAGVSLRPGGVLGVKPGEQLEQGTVTVFAKATIGQRTTAAERDWMRFLYETEDRYWQTMYRFLKDELKVRGLITGTIVGCAPPGLMAKMDWVDTHSYWQHPSFPVRPWDSEEWIVNNKTMVNERGGTLPGLALKRVAGKPHACTEYNHSAPNTYSSEGFLLLAAYAALQDWDAIYPFAWSHSGSENWNSQKIGSFFDIDQHPTKLVTLVAAGAMFTRGDISPAKTLVAADLTPDREIDLLRSARSWGLVDAGTLGVPREASLVHRVAINTGSQPTPGALRRDFPPNEYHADTGELFWDLREEQRGVVTINSPYSKGVIGYGGGGSFALGSVTIEPGRTRQRGWSTITVTAMDRTASPSKRWLVIATGLAENTGMVWKNAEKSSVGRQWGKAPSLVEGIRARITFTTTGGQYEAWALDSRGQRAQPVPVVSNGLERTLTIGPQWQTLWYEVRQKGS